MSRYGRKDTSCGPVWHPVAGPGWQPPSDALAGSRLSECFSAIDQGFHRVKQVFPGVAAAPRSDPCGDIEFIHWLEVVRLAGDTLVDMTEVAQDPPIHNSVIMAEKPLDAPFRCSLRSGIVMGGDKRRALIAAGAKNVERPSWIGAPRGRRLASLIPSHRKPRLGTLNHAREQNTKSPEGHADFRNLS